MFKKQIQKSYLLYGGAIIIARGLEYVILFSAASLLTKEDYGELEYYKKFIEVFSSIIAFGFPSLILSYTRSSDSKTYFYFLSCMITLVLSVITIPLFSFYKLTFLITPLLFYALFFNGGITPSYLLVKMGGKKAAYYKIITSILFYTLLYFGLNYFDISSNLYPFGGTWLLPVFSIYLIFVFWNKKIVLIKLKKYWKLFRKLLVSSFTLVLSNFSNLMFLYTDIFLIKFIAKNPDVMIADFSFALNVAATLLLIPITLVQVDIEKLKQNIGYIKILNRRIIVLVFLASVILVTLYPILVRNLFELYEDTIVLFIILLIAKIFHSLSTLYGTNLLILKKFSLNLNVNLFFLALNIIFCYLGYILFGILGVASSSAIALGLRYIVLMHYNNKYIEQKYYK
ncbi:MAG: oligosaccharide flippase family protein [Patiriisocius sp.]|uniref:oligosaccharide flippase family protein n=1 Tax=Patiriisocius sp. TaxID=2822396 RepID=UPI003EF3E56C